MATDSIDFSNTIQRSHQHNLQDRRPLNHSVSLLLSLSNNQSSALQSRLYSSARSGTPQSTSSAHHILPHLHLRLHTTMARIINTITRRPYLFSATAIFFAGFGWAIHQQPRPAPTQRPAIKFAPPTRLPPPHSIPPRSNSSFPHLPLHEPFPPPKSAPEYDFHDNDTAASGARELLPPGRDEWNCHN